MSSEHHQFSFAIMNYLEPTEVLLAQSRYNSAENQTSRTLYGSARVKERTKGSIFSRVITASSRLNVREISPAVQ